jgi:sugar (pentulose or hexulose) kinase
MLAAEMVSGDLLHVVGTTQVLAAFTERPRPDPRRLSRRHGVGDAFVHVTHNPVGGAAFEWLRELCFRDQDETTFFEHTLPSALKRDTKVCLDPPFLGGDRLEIDDHRAGFQELTLSTDRLDLVTGVLRAMERGHRTALADLGMGGSFRRVFLSGGGAGIVRKLIPEYRNDPVQLLDEASLCGVARLFERD